MSVSTPLIPLGQAQPCPPPYFRFVTVLFAVVSLLLLGVGAAAQRRSPAPAPEEESSAFKAYRGVQLGMTADEVRKKLGSPKDKGDEQDFFVFGDNESAQIVYDPTHKVVTISADFLATDGSVPTGKDVFGSEVEAKPDGSMYKMVRYPKAGYWLSYNRTGGASPMTSITLQKIQ